MTLFTLCLIPVFVVSSSALQDNERYLCGTQFSPYVEQHDQPVLDPPKYTAAISDPKEMKPFKIHFIVSPNISQEMRHVINSTLEYVNGRLPRIVKAPPVTEIRRQRTWNATLKLCDVPSCEYSYVPGGYALPCRDPQTNNTLKEDNVPEHPNDDVKRLNSGNDITLVVYVDAENSSDLNVHYCKSKETSVAHAAICQRHPVSNRPTHGMIGICANAQALKGGKAARIVLHEILHILLSGSIVGMGSPSLGCMTRTINDVVMPPFHCENITFKSVQQQWQAGNLGPRRRRTRLLVITENVKKAAKEYFKCDSVEGADAQVYNITVADSALLNGTVTPGTPYVSSHWSAELFPEEIMMPAIHGAARLSNLTLALLKDLGWYEVNMSAAEPMEVTRPKQSGCDIARKHCQEIIEKTREDQLWPDAPPPDMGPYCDDDYTNEDWVSTPQCINDMEPLQCSKIKGMVPNECAVVLRPTFYDQFTCHQTGTLPDYPVQLGGKVGPGTICVPILATNLRTPKGGFGLCVAYRCDNNVVHINLQPYGNVTCEIPCPAAKSGKSMEASFRDLQCRKYLGLRFTIACPNFRTVCPTPTMSPPPPSSKASTQSPTDPAINAVGVSESGKEGLKCDAFIMGGIVVGIIMIASGGFY